MAESQYIYDKDNLSYHEFSKIGMSTNYNTLVNRKNSGKTELMYSSSYYRIWLIRKINPNKNILYAKWDNLIFKFPKNLTTIIEYEKNNNCYLPYFRALNNYFTNFMPYEKITSGKEFISKICRDVINGIITTEFKYFNLEVVKIFTQDELNIINNTKLCKTREVITLSDDESDESDVDKMDLC